MVSSLARTITHSGVWRPEDRVAAIYRYLPVEVPPGAPGLRVTLEYDRSAGVIDLGCVGANGFRGWSGGARSEYVITPMTATPGYLPGELEPGEWSVVLGLHRVPPEGIPWRVTATIEPASVPPDPPPPPAPVRPARRDLPAAAGLTWYAGDLHAHTVHSDGSLTIDELACLAAARGLDFLAITDHNTVSHHRHLPAAGDRAGVLLVPGQEVTTDRGHANAFGDIGWVDFRAPATEWVSTVAQRGGLLSINHPLAADYAWRHLLAQRPPLAEIWHVSWLERRWGGPLAWWQAWGYDTIPIGGSDFHSSDEGFSLGAPTTWVACEELSVAGVLDGLAAGRVAISAEPRGPVLVRVEDDLIALDADGAILTEPSGRRRIVTGDRARFPAEPGPHWLEDGQTRVLAIAA